MSSKKTSISDIIKQCKAAANSFSADLDVLYPTYIGKNGRENDPTERNITIHLAKVFSKKYHIFAELGQYNFGRNHLDLVMLKQHPHRHRTKSEVNLDAEFVICECKRTYNTEHVGPSRRGEKNGIIHDLKRIESFKRPDRHNIWYKGHGRYFGMLAIVNFSKDSKPAKCWVDREAWDKELSRGTHLAKLLREMDRISGGITKKEQLACIPLGASRPKNKNIGKYDDLYGNFLFFVCELTGKR